MGLKTITEQLKKEININRVKILKKLAVQVFGT